MIPTVTRRWFAWSSQWFYSWPVKIVTGEDEYGWRTVGLVTWAGSIFWRRKMCWDDECVQIRNEYWERER